MTIIFCNGCPCMARITLPRRAWPVWRSIIYGEWLFGLLKGSGSPNSSLACTKEQPFFFLLPAKGDILSLNQRGLICRERVYCRALLGCCGVVTIEQCHLVCRVLFVVLSSKGKRLGLSIGPVHAIVWLEQNTISTSSSSRLDRGYATTTCHATVYHQKLHCRC